MSSNQVSYEALRRARFMAFNYYPHSQAAEAFCKELTEELLNKEIRKRKRRAGDLVNFKKAVRLIVSDLLAHLDRDGPEWLYRSMRNDAFVDIALSKAAISVCHSLTLVPMVPDLLVGLMHLKR